MDAEKLAWAFRPSVLVEMANDLAGCLNGNPDLVAERRRELVRFYVETCVAIRTLNGEKFMTDNVAPLDKLTWLSFVRS